MKNSIQEALQVIRGNSVNEAFKSDTKKTAMLIHDLYTILHTSIKPFRDIAKEDKEIAHDVKIIENLGGKLRAALSKLRAKMIVNSKQFNQEYKDKLFTLGTVK